MKGMVWAKKSKREPKMLGRPMMSLSAGHCLEQSIEMRQGVVVSPDEKKGSDIDNAMQWQENLIMTKSD